MPKAKASNQSGHISGGHATGSSSNGAPLTRPHVINSMDEVVCEANP